MSNKAIEWVSPPKNEGQEVKPDFRIEWQDGLEREEDIEVIAKEILIAGKSYLYSVFGNDYPFPKHYNIIIGRRKSHANLGAEMHLSSAQLKSYKESAEITRDVCQSLIIHELVHNLRDEEDLSMLIEMIYILERNGMQRIEELKSMLNDGRLGNVYIDGLRTIASWFGYHSPKDFLENIGQIDISHMKGLFKSKVNTVIEELNKEAR